MATARVSRCFGMVLRVLLLFCATGTLPVHAADAAKSPDESYLDELQGKWVMAGTLGGKPVRYFAEGQRIYQAAYD